jgi:hypothetical protein
MKMPSDGRDSTATSDRVKCRARKSAPADMYLRSPQVLRVDIGTSQYVKGSSGFAVLGRLIVC